MMKKRKIDSNASFYLEPFFAAAFLFLVRAAFFAEALRWAFVLFAIEKYTPHLFFYR